MGFGAKLKELLKNKKMTIKELSEKTGISINTLYSITKRDTRLPSDDIMYKISNALDVELKDMIDFDDAKSKISENLQVIEKNAKHIETLLSEPHIKEQFSDDELNLILQFMEFAKFKRDNKENQ